MKYRKILVFILLLFSKAFIFADDLFKEDYSDFYITFSVKGVR